MIVYSLYSSLYSKENKKIIMSDETIIDKELMWWLGSLVIGLLQGKGSEHTARTKLQSWDKEFRMIL